MKISSLHDVQRWMRWAIVGRGKKPVHAPVVIGRMEIYEEGYYLRLIDCLAANFSSVRNVIGANAFSEIMRRYLHKYPSTSKCIDDVGGNLPTFIKKQALSRRYPYLADLARLEWGYHQAFYADDQPGFDLKRIQGRTQHQWMRAHVRLDAAIRLLELSWPVDQLWRDEGHWSPQRLKGLRPKKTYLLIYRRADALVRVKRVEREAFQLLLEFQAGRPFGQAFHRALSKSRANAPSVMAWFNEWARSGVISKVLF